MSDTFDVIEELGTHVPMEPRKSTPVVIMTPFRAAALEAEIARRGRERDVARAEVERLRGACELVMMCVYVQHNQTFMCQICGGNACSEDGIIHLSWCPVPVARAALEPAP